MEEKQVIRRLNWIYYGQMAIACIVCGAMAFAAHKGLYEPLDTMSQLGKIVQYIVIFDALITIPLGLYLIKWFKPLTNEKYFGGSTAFIQAVRALVPDLPILRKEFIIDEYQVYEAKIIGADAILLIAAALTPDHYSSLLCTAHSLGLEVLLEVHAPEELAYLDAGIPDMLGVNNRSLGTFHTDVQHSFDIAEQMQAAVAHLPEAERPLLVSESGISDPDIVRQLRRSGFRGFLIGECFMKEDEPGKALRQFISKL